MGQSYVVEVGAKLLTVLTQFIVTARVLAQDADVLIHEATFFSPDSKLAFERLHSTSTMA